MIPRVAVTGRPSELARELMEDARRLGTPNPDVYLVLDAVPGLMLTFHEHWRAMFDSGVVGRELKELVRRKIANYIDCATCKSVAVEPIDAKLAASYAWRDSDTLDARERAAMWLVDYLMGFADDADALYAELHARFDDAEIVELGWFIAFNAGTVRLVRSWSLHEEGESKGGST